MAARATAIPNANPAGTPYLLPLPAPGPYGVGDPVTDALAQTLTQAGQVTPYAAVAGPAASRPDLAALGLNDIQMGNITDPTAGAQAAGLDQWQSAIQNAQLGSQYIQNSNFVAGKANEFRETAVIRLREIYGRLLSIQDQAALLGPAAQAAAGAQAALVELINAVNAQGYIDPQQAQAMADLATQLQNIDIPQMMAGLIGEINDIANNIGVNAANRNPADAGPVPLTGGRRRKKTRKKTHKGGYKFTRAAISRRSLRQSRRKSLSREHKRKKKRKHKRKKTHRKKRR